MKVKYFLLPLLILAYLQPVFPQNGGQCDKVSEFTKSRKFYKRAQWFFGPRSAPYDTISITRLNEELEKATTVSRQKSSAQTNPWIPLGPHGINSFFPSHWGVNSGRCRGIDVHPQNPDIAYIGAAAGGIWKTTNGGNNWQCVSESFSANTFGAIAIDPVNPQTVYAGTGEAVSGFSPNIYYGNGIYKTTNGGSTWNRIAPELGNYTHVGDIVVSPHNSNLVYAGLTSANYFLGTLGNTGLWRSTDGGISWTRTLAVRDVYDIEVHPVNPDIVYAASGGGTDPAGFYISNDKGATWNRITSGFPTSDLVGRVQISLCKSNPLIIYALIFGTTTSAWKSTDGGYNWSQCTSANPLGGYHASMNWYDQGNYDLCIAVKPDNPDFVLAGNVELHKATDGNSFKAFRVNGGNDVWSSPVHCDYHRIVFSPSNPNIVYIGSDGGIFKSTDGGQSWTNKNNGISTIQFYCIASHPTDRNTIIGGAQDNGNFRTQNSGTSNWDMTTSGDGMNCFFDHTNPGNVYSSIQYGEIYKSTQSGAFGSYYSITPPYSTGETPFWTAPFFMHPTNNNIIYVASTRLWKSLNAGSNWTPVSAAFPQAITSVAQNSLYPDVMILCAGGGFLANPPVYVSTNGGSQWINVSGSLPGPARYISAVKTDPNKRNTVYVVRSGFGSSKILRSDNLGAAWTDISGNLPDVPHNDLFVDPQIPNTMYAANDFGVYKTSDGGLNWNRLSEGLSIVPVIKFSYAEYGSTRLLRIGTFGRSAYEMELPDANTAFLNLNSPAGGEKFIQGSRAQLRWSYNLVSRINVLFSKDNKQSWQTIVYDYPADSMKFSWLVPVISSDSCYITIMDKANSQIFQVNELPFSVGPMQSPELVSPAIGATGFDNEPAKFSWNAAQGSVYYHLQISADQTFSTPVYDDSLLTSVETSVSGLANNTRYYWRAGSRNELLSTVYSPVRSFKTILAKPALTSPPNNSTNQPVSVDLKWEAVPGAERYHLQVASTVLFSSLIINDSTLTTNTYKLNNLSVNRSYYWKVKAVNSDGSGKFSSYFKFQTSPVSVDNTNAALLPLKTELSNNFPNPFNPETVINYQTANPGKVVIKLYDLLGHEVAELVNKDFGAGYHHFRLSITDYHLSSGIYLCQMNAGKYIGTIKLTVLK